MTLATPADQGFLPADGPGGSPAADLADVLVAPSPHRPGVVARGLRALVKGYQALFAGRPSPCRFTPTCSAYAVEALEQHGAVRGLLLTLRRLGRCHPWGPFGFDPVPDRRAS